MKRLSSARQPLPALLGLVVIVLQIVGALHFTLVRHGYSAALGGVVHVHTSARADKTRLEAAPVGTPALVSNVRACAVELCPDANAPQGATQHFELAATGFVAFGQVCLLGESAACSSEALRIFLSAPKTSPPV
jgi:hypothetical protein